MAEPGAVADPNLDFARLIPQVQVVLKRLAEQVATKGRKAVRAYLAAKAASLARLGE
jgi:hypothetical protein